MEKLSRKTSKKCLICGKGEIIENFILNSKSGPLLIVDSRIPIKKWITSEFYCDTCGYPVRLTPSNGLIHFDKEKVLRIMSNSYELEIEINRDVAWNEILPVNKDSAKIVPKEGFKKGQRLIGFYKERYDSIVLNNFNNHDEIYLIVYPKKPPIFLNKLWEIQNRRKEKIDKILEHGNKMIANGQKEEAISFVQKRIKGATWEEGFGFLYPHYTKIEIRVPKIPKNAIPATSVKILDNDFNITEYWVPADAVTV